MIRCHFFRQKSDNFQILMNVDGYAVADNGYGDDKVVLSFELILTLMNHSLMVLMVLTLMIMKTSMPTLITELEEKEEGQGLGELKNLGNYLSAPTADLRNYFFATRDAS